MTTTLKSVLSGCENLSQLEVLLNDKAQMTIGACGGRRFTNEKLGIGSISLSEIFKKFQELKSKDNDAQLIRTIVTKLNDFDLSDDNLLLSQSCLIRFLTAIRRLFGNCCFDLKASLSQARTELPQLTQAQELWNLAVRYSKIDLGKAFKDIHSSEELDEVLASSLDTIDDVESWQIQCKVESFCNEVDKFNLEDLPRLCTEIQNSKKSLEIVFQVLFQHKDITLSNLDELLSIFNVANPVNFLDRFCKAKEVIKPQKVHIKKGEKTTYTYTRMIIDHTRISENGKQIPDRVIKYLSEKLLNHASHTVETFKAAVKDTNNNDNLCEVPCGIGLSFSLNEEQEVKEQQEDNDVEEDNDDVDGEVDVIDDEIINARNVIRALLSYTEMQKIPHLVHLNLTEISRFELSDVKLLNSLVNNQPFLNDIQVANINQNLFKNLLTFVKSRQEKALLTAIKEAVEKK